MACSSRISPAHVSAVALEKTEQSLGSPKEATQALASESRASPARMVSVVPKTVWQAGLPRLVAALSMTSSCMRVAAWSISSVQPSV